MDTTVSNALMYKNNVYIRRDSGLNSDTNNLGKTIGIAVYEKKGLADYIWPFWVNEYKDDKEHNRIFVRGLMDLGSVYEKKHTVDEGKFLGAKSDAITVSYNIESKKDFYVSADFEIVSGRVDWEIVNPKNEPVFKGYVINENGKMFRELTYPSNYSGRITNEKLEVMHSKPSIVSENYNPSFIFPNLKFEPGYLLGEYKLKLTPINSEGSYKVQWSTEFTVQ
jgi:hypothetical protein